MKNFPAISIIDDAAIDCLIAKKLCERITPTATIHTFSSVKEAFYSLIHCTINHPEDLPDIIFLDIDMPIADGWDFLDQYQFLLEHITETTCQIYVLSASIDPKDIEKSKQYTFVNGFICKPLTLEIISAINQSYFLHHPQR